MKRAGKIIAVSLTVLSIISVLIQTPLAEAAFTLELDASYAEGLLSLDFILGTSESATWSNYLILIDPTVQVIPLWTVPLPVISPPISLPISFPLPSMGLIGIWTGLFTAQGAQAVEMAWVETSCWDTDGDGYLDETCGGDDCDDGEPNVNPGIPEGPAGDPTCSDGIDNDCNSLADIDEPKCNPDDLDMTAEDFECLLDWPEGDVYRLTNKRGHLAEALAVAQSPTGGLFPPGTVIALISGEAMVKRAPGWNLTTSDWEFFNLDVSETGTVIEMRGGEEVVGDGGAGCFGCHAEAEPQWDLVCRKTHGCEPLVPEIPDEFIRFLQTQDPRCP